MSTSAIDFSKYEQQPPPPAKQIDFAKYASAAPAAKSQSEPGFLDKEIPLDSYGNATLSGVQSIGRAARGMVEGIPAMIKHPLAGIAAIPSQVAQVPAAISDINKSNDPIGTYAKVAQETAAQGGVQAAQAAATEGLINGATSLAKPALQMAGKGAQAVAARIPQSELATHVLGVIYPPAAHALRIAQKVSKIASKLGEDSEEAAPAVEAAPQPSAQPAPAPVQAPEPKTSPVYRDATLNKRNIPEYAGEGDDAAPPTRKPSPLEQAAALKQPTNDVIDSHIPPSGETRGTNMLTKAKIDFHLQRGDVQGAQAVLDQATGKTTNFPPDAPKVVPSVQNIRENAGQVQAAEAQPRRYGSQDAMDDRALGQEMNWNLQKHGFMAESEARREFIANNSTGMTKGELNRQFDAAAGKPAVPDKPVKYTKTPGVNAVDPDEDLTDLLKKSLAAARAKKR